MRPTVRRTDLHARCRFLRRRKHTAIRSAQGETFPSYIGE